MGNYDGFDENWLLDYRRKRAGQSDSPPDFLTAEAQRLKRQAARDGGADRMMREHKVQTQAVQQMRLILSHNGEDPDALNGNDGGSNDERERQRLIDLGYVVGTPDLFVSVMRGGFGGLAIEVKTVDGRASRVQVDQCEKWQRRGYAVAITYGVEQTVRALVDYLKLPATKNPPELTG